MYTDGKILESIRKVEAARAENVKLNPARMSAEEKEVLLKTFHPDYRENQFTTLNSHTFYLLTLWFVSSLIIFPSSR